MKVREKAQMKNKTVKLPTKGLNVRAGFQPETFNEDDRTIEVVFSTGSKGKRGFWTEYFEELSMKKSDIRLERLNQGAPVLNNHSRSNGLEGVIGVVEKAWIRNKEGIAKIRFSERDEVQGIVRDIQSGVIRNVSVGYTVHKYEDVSKKNDEIPTYRAVDWEPMEISFVDIPFDKDSQARSIENNDTYECIIERTEEKDMNIEDLIRAACKKAGLNDEVAEDMISREISQDEIDGEVKRALATKEKNDTEETPVVETEVETEETRSQETETEVETEVETPVVDLDAERKIAAETERTRGLEIRTVAKDLKLDENLIDEHIERGTSVDEFRKIAISTKAKSDEANKTNSHNIEVKDMDKRELRMRGAENALLNRFKKSNYELTEEGKEFRHGSLVDLGRQFLEAEGVSTQGLAPIKVAERALHTSSDFKEILANVANKSMMDAYSEVPQTFAPIVNEVEVSDFKEISRTQLHSGAGLSKVNEHGEYEHTTLSESAEKYSIQTFGKIIGVTRQTLVNDDLGAFTRIPGQMGMKARSLESKMIWALITSNPVMADGNALFSAAHGNLGSTGPINVANVNEGMSKMMLQTDLDKELIDIMPEFLAGPSIQAATIKQFLGATVPSQDAEINPFKGDLSPIIERRLDAHSQAAWYLFSSARMIDMIEIARLQGENGPVITQKEGFEIDGLKMKIRYDFGVKVLDHRGFFKNAGA